MPFDLSSASPILEENNGVSGFDLSTAQPERFSSGVPVSSSKQISSRSSKYVAPNLTATLNANSPSNDHKIENFIYGSLKGGADLAYAPAQLIANGIAKISGNGAIGRKTKELAEQLNNYVKKQEDTYQSLTPGSTSAGVGRFIGGAAPFLLSGGTTAAAQTPGIFPKIYGIGKSAITGAGFSAAQPVDNVETYYDPSTGEKTNDYFGKKFDQLKNGAMFGAAAKPIAATLGRVISPQTSSDVEKLINEGVTPTIGQILGGAFKTTEDKATSIPLVGDFIKNAQRRSIEQFNTAAQNRALNPIGQKSSGIGREGFYDMKNKLGKAYDDLLPNLQFKADPQFSAETSNLINMVNNGNIPPEISEQFQNILKNDVFSRMTNKGTMDGKNFQQMKESLSKKIKGYNGSTDPDQRILGSALDEALSSARGVLKRSNPEYLQQLDAIDKGYANYARIRDASTKLGADGGIFTPAQLQNSVRNQDNSVGKSAFGSGNALMQDLSESGKNVLGSNYPDSGTAGRMMLGGLASIGSGAGLNAIGLGSVNPFLAATGAASILPYTKLGQFLTSKALTARPDSAGALSNLLNKSAPYIGSDVSPYFTSD